MGNSRRRKKTNHRGTETPRRKKRYRV